MTSESTRLLDQDQNRAVAVAMHSPTSSPPSHSNTYQTQLDQYNKKQAYLNYISMAGFGFLFLAGLSLKIPRFFQYEVDTIDTLSAISAWIGFAGTIAYGIADSYLVKQYRPKDPASVSPLETSTRHFFITKVLPFIVSCIIGNAAEYMIDSEFSTPRGIASFICSDFASALAVVGFVVGSIAPLFAVLDNGVEGFAITLALSGHRNSSTDTVVRQLGYGMYSGSLAGLAGGVIYKSFINPLMVSEIKRPKSNTFYWLKLFTLYIIRGAIMEALRTLINDENQHTLEQSPGNFASRLGTNLIVGGLMGGLMGVFIHFMKRYDRRSSLNRGDFRPTRQQEMITSALGMFAINDIYNLLVPLLESLVLKKLGVIDSHAPIKGHDQHHIQFRA